MLKCTDEPMSVPENDSGECRTEIYTTQERPVEEVSSYFSYFKSFLRREPEGNIRDREGVVLVLLDGAYETDIIETMIEMDSRMYNNRKDVCVGVRSKT